MKNKESEGVPENKGVGLDNTEDGELYKTIRSWRDNLYCGHYHNECMDLVNKIYSKFSLPVTENKGVGLDKANFRPYLIDAMTDFATQKEVRSVQSKFPNLSDIIKKHEKLIYSMLAEFKRLNPSAVKEAEGKQ